MGDIRGNGVWERIAGGAADRTERWGRPNREASGPWGPSYVCGDSEAGSRPALSTLGAAEGCEQQRRAGCVRVLIVFCGSQGTD